MDNGLRCNNANLLSFSIFHSPLNIVFRQINNSHPHYIIGSFIYMILFQFWEDVFTVDSLLIMDN